MSKQGERVKVIVFRREINFRKPKYKHKEVNPKQCV